MATDNQTIHEAICIPFEIEGEPFEAVGFLREWDPGIRGVIALERVNNGHIVETEKDWRLLYESRAQLPRKLWRYCLVTSLPSANGPNFVSVLVHHDDDEWCEHGFALHCQWNKGELVLRRRQPPSVVDAFDFRRRQAHTVRRRIADYDRAIDPFADTLDLEPVDDNLPPAS